VSYNYGKLDGLYREWHEDGNLEIECTYRDGNYDGLCRKWDKHGVLLEDCIYKNGLLIHKIK
jgi:antitoxin component YwqK of YwqJK toxin-antitoxin module